MLDDGEVAVAKDAVVVHCAAPGLVYPPMVPIWREEAITLQPVRSGFPCFGAAIAGHVEATRDGDEEKNRLCPPSPLPNTTAGLGADAGAGQPRVDVLRLRPRAQGLGRPDLAQPGAVPPDLVDSAEVGAAVERFRAHLGPGLARMEQLAGMA